MKKLVMLAVCLYGSVAYASICDMPEQKTPAAWYARGCEAYTLGEYARACGFWHRACAVGGNAQVRERCVQNFRCAYKKLHMDEMHIPWWQRLSTAATRVPLLWLQIIFLISVYAALLFVYQGRRKRATRFVLASIYTVAVLITGILLLNWYLIDARSLGVVVLDQQVLYAGPGSDFPERGRVTEGHMVELCNLRGEWYKVRSSAGGTGWLPRVALMSVKP